MNVFSTGDDNGEILFSQIFNLNVHVSIFFFFTTMDYINTVHV